MRQCWLGTIPLAILAVSLLALTPRPTAQTPRSGATIRSAR